MDEFKVFLNMYGFTTVFYALDYYYIDVLNDIQPSISPFFRHCNFIKVVRRMSDKISSITITLLGVIWMDDSLNDV